MLVWEAFSEAKPGPDHEFEAWAEEAAPQFGLSPDQVKRIIAEQSEMALFRINQAGYTEAQQVAKTMGLSVTSILEKTKQLLEAETDEILKTKDGPIFKTGPDGLPLKDDDGNLIPMVYTRPDNRAIIEAIKLGAQVLGAFAPQWNISDQTVTHRIENISDADLQKRLAELETGVRGHLEAPAVGAPDTPRRKGRKNSASGQVVLVDALHEDEGRAGQDGQPVQAVPGT